MESCDVGLQKDDKYGWKLIVKGDCEEVLEDIKNKLGEYGQRYFEDRLVIEPADKNDAPSTENKPEEN